MSGRNADRVPLSRCADSARFRPPGLFRAEHGEIRVCGRSRPRARRRQPVPPVTAWLLRP
jgi:hypothetical protein